MTECIKRHLQSNESHLHYLLFVPGLRMLNRQARAAVFQSYRDEFEIPGIESGNSEHVVVASVIGVHRQIYVDSAEYLNPHRGLRQVFDPANVSDRGEPIGRDAIVAKSCDLESPLRRWNILLIPAQSSPRCHT